MIEKFLVIVNKDFDDEEIYYCGVNQILAFKKFKELPNNIYKQIVKANVKIIKIAGTELIDKYEIIERIA
ncbi:hypothetical protein D9O40_00625 [Clostridium autoethanogenum]|uniref:Uncharacterized protein n=1 Tax=Clostridium autoethanogenum TaxID=84023 RepID=A0A3M0T2N9_9CLOT|nr:hypothetical protein [Clostridium autoethanogenum]RMD04890.1 hypothetical protein D9O40_00625 [Clostridium autoethanogenum]